jgi:hypothetical protein
MAHDLFANLIPEAEQAKTEGVTVITKRLHRRLGSKQVVDGVLTGIDSRGFCWLKWGKRVHYINDRNKQRLDKVCRKAGGRHSITA